MQLDGILSQLEQGEGTPWAWETALPVSLLQAVVSVWKQGNMGDWARLGSDASAGDGVEAVTRDRNRRSILEFSGR